MASSGGEVLPSAGRLVKPGVPLDLLSALAVTVALAGVLTGCGEDTSAPDTSDRADELTVAMAAADQPAPSRALVRVLGAVTDLEDQGLTGGGEPQRLVQPEDLLGADQGVARGQHLSNPGELMTVVPLRLLSSTAPPQETWRVHCQPFVNTRRPDLGGPGLLGTGLRSEYRRVPRAERRYPGRGTAGRGS